jgi:hypothetical protein
VKIEAKPGRYVDMVLSEGALHELGVLQIGERSVDGVLAVVVGPAAHFPTSANNKKNIIK